MNTQEPHAVIARYARRHTGNQYSMLRPEVYLSVQERQRAMLNLFGQKFGLPGFSELALTEVGCGTGGNLLDFLRFGFKPENLCGIELLPERAVIARNTLPAALAIHEGDANTANIAPASQDIVFQSVVFSSLLDDDFQQSLANRMWQWTKPGGGVLWYDFIYNNPANSDVRGVPIKRIRALFPDGEILVRRVTLAPPSAAGYVRFIRMHTICSMRSLGCALMYFAGLESRNDAGKQTIPTLCATGNWE